MGWIWVIGAVVGWWLAGSFINGPLDLFLLQTAAKSHAGYRSYPGVRRYG